MKQYLVILILSILPHWVTWAQKEDANKFDGFYADSLYREDQFYLSVTHSLQINSVKNFSSSGVSIGTTFGFIRDFPINKQRNIAIGLGTGLRFNNLNNNLFYADQNTPINIANDYKVNQHNLWNIDFPIEFRYRTSTIDSYEFFRLYGGLKLSYLFYDRYTFSSPSQSFSIVHRPDVNKFNYSIYASIGYGTWSIYAQYNIRPLYKGTAMESLNYADLGIIFYIL